jgi:hypothetical protein
MKLVLYFISIIGGIITASEGYIIQHYSVADFDVEVHVQYDTQCSSKQDFSTIVTVPRGSSVLNVLEYANQNYPTFDGFKVAFSGSYQVVCINGDCAENTCVWKVTTDPVTIATVPINEIFVTNVGMVVYFKFEDSSFMPLTPSYNYNPSGPNSSLSYSVEYVSPCQAPSQNVADIPSTPYTVSYIMGESALNVMERAALKEPVHNFVLSNIFGRFYVIHTFNDQPTTQSCLWCVYYSPSSSGTPSYHITSDINNFIVPLPQGSLKIKYEASCGNSAVNALSRNNLANVPLPVPPHFNPFL